MNQAKLIDAVRVLASKYPGFHYKSKLGRHVVDYHEGGDSRYPEAKGCIIGQALRSIGGSRYLPVDGLSTDCASELGVPGETDEGDQWLDDVQQFQCEGYGWMTCVEMADAAQRGEDPKDYR